MHASVRPLAYARPSLGVLGWIRQHPLVAQIKRRQRGAQVTAGVDDAALDDLVVGAHAVVEDAAEFDGHHVVLVAVHDQHG